MGKPGKNFHLWSISFEYERRCAFYDTEWAGQSVSPPNHARPEPPDEAQPPSKGRGRRRQPPQRPDADSS